MIMIMPQMHAHVSVVLLVRGIVLVGNNLSINVHFEFDMDASSATDSDICTCKLMRCLIHCSRSTNGRVQ